MRRRLTGKHSATVEVPFYRRVYIRGFKVFRLCDKWRGCRGLTYQVYTREVKALLLCDEWGDIYILGFQS